MFDVQAAAGAWMVRMRFLISNAAALAIPRHASATEFSRKDTPGITWIF